MFKKQLKTSIKQLYKTSIEQTRQLEMSFVQKTKATLAAQHQNLDSPIEMELSGTKDVLKNILIKKKLLDEKNPEHEKIKTVLLLPGGGQAGVFEAGVVVALEKLGLNDAFDYVVGVSIGAATGMYFMSKDAALGTTCFSENAKNKMIDLFRTWKILDLRIAEKYIRGENLPDFSMLHNSRTAFLVGLTNLETGDGKFVDIRKVKDPVSYIIASSSVPILNGEDYVELDGKKYVDGGLALSAGFEYVVNTIKPTDILVALPGSPKNMENVNSLVKATMSIMSKIMTPAITKRWETYHERLQKEYQLIISPQTSSTKVAAIHPLKTELDFLTNDVDLLRKAVLTSKVFTEQLLKEAKLEITYGVFGKAFYALSQWLKSFLSFLHNTLLRKHN